VRRRPCCITLCCWWMVDTRPRRKWTQPQQQTCFNHFGTRCGWTGWRTKRGVRLSRSWSRYVRDRLSGGSGQPRAWINAGSLALRVISCFVSLESTSGEHFVWAQKPFGHGLPSLSPRRSIDPICNNDNDKIKGSRPRAIDVPPIYSHARRRRRWW
jgi:hypothetical protein